MKLLESILLFAFLVFALLSLSWAGSAVVLVYLALHLSLLALKKSEEKYSALLIGFLIPLVPWFGSGTLLCIALIYLLLERNNFSSLNARWSHAFLILCGGWVLVEWIILAPVGEISAFFRQGITWESFNTFKDWLKKSPPDAYQSTLQLARYFTIVLFFSALSVGKEKQLEVLKGLAAGLAVAFLATAATLVGVSELTSANQNQYWTAIGRFSGTFSDPNALAISLALLLPPVIGLALTLNNFKKILVIELCLFFSLLVLYSGSRSFVIAVVIYLAWLVFRYSPKIGYFCVILGGLLVLGFNLGVDDPKILFSNIDLPQSIQRVLNSIHYTSASDALFSRIAFAKIAWLVWVENPLFGIGFGLFPQFVVPYAYWLELPTGLWIDNANNFYASILVELGLLGAIAFIYSVRQLSWNLSEDTITTGAKLSLAVFIVLLLLGPHIYFDEVALITALLMSVSLVPSTKHFTNYMYVAFFLIVCVGAVFKLRELDQGFYPWEKDNTSNFRWTEDFAWGHMPCVKNNIGLLRLQALHPDISEESPVKVKITTYDKDQEVVLTNSAEKRIAVECEKPEKRFFYELSVERLWIPALVSESTDPRPLGIQLRTGRPVGAPEE